MRSLRDFDLKNKKVLIRVDFNVPMENEKIIDDTRIIETLPTINYVIQSFGKAILCSHLGRPKGKRSPEFSLKPVYEYLKKILKAPVKFLEDLTEDSVDRMIKELKEGEVLLLENVRFYIGETENSIEFAKLLAKFADIFINDAFSVCHRVHASVVGVANLVREKGIGFQMEKELKYLSKVVSKPERPFYAVVGGSKVSSKIGILKNLINKVDKLIIGGAMANTFLHAKGYSVGASLLENNHLDTAKEIMKYAKEQEVKLYLPVDVVVERDEDIMEIGLAEITEDDKIFDIGTETIKLFSHALEGSKTLIWNGPMGYFEKPPFHKGTVALARKIASLPSVTIAGGGDTILAIKLAGVETAFSYISTAGGAFLEYLEGKELPGLKVLKS